MPTSSAPTEDYRVVDYRPWGGVDVRSINCPLANVAIPATGALPYAAPNFAPGTLNQCDNGATTDLLNKSRIHSLFLTALQDLPGNATLWGDLLYSDRKTDIRVAPPVQTLTIFNTNPFFIAPPGTGATAETVLFRMDNLFGSDHLTQNVQLKVGNSSFGVDIPVLKDMNLSVYGTADWATNDAYQPGVNTAALAAAAAGTTPANALDPFGTRTSPAVAAAITNLPTRVTVEQRTYLGAAKIDGPVARLPGGDLKVAAGAEYRRETFTQDGYVGATPVPESLGRNISSAYGELFVPIFGAGNAAPGLHRLTLSLSSRYDRYSDFGSTTNPKYGINWDPVDGFTLRGTYGNSFRAPGIRQMGATVGSVYLPASFAAILAPDPTRGPNQVDTIYLIGGNLGLTPEKARTYSFGLDLRPRSLPNLHASATFYDIDFTDAVGQPTSGLVFSDPTFASSVIRNPTPAQVQAFLANSNAVPINLPNPLPPIGNLLDLRVGNFGIRRTNGLDLDLGYRWPTSFGPVFAGIAGNHVLKYDTQLSPGSPVANGLRLGVPRTTARATVGTQVGTVGVVSFVNYPERDHEHIHHTHRHGRVHRGFVHDGRFARHGGAAENHLERGIGARPPGERRLRQEAAVLSRGPRWHRRELQPDRTLLRAQPASGVLIATHVARASRCHGAPLAARKAP
jgi:iron complex outermembrane receptor protein